MLAVGGVALAAAAVSWILALALLVIVAGLYLDGLRRRERSRKRRLEQRGKTIGPRK